MASEQRRQLLLHQGQHLALLPPQQVSYRAGLNPHSALLQLTFLCKPGKVHEDNARFLKNILHFWPNCNALEEEKKGALIHFTFIDIMQLKTLP